MIKGKVLVILEPKKEWGLLPKMNQLRNHIETKIFCSPLLNKLVENNEIIVVPSNGFIDKNFKEMKEITIRKKDFIDKDNYFAIIQAIGISKIWHSYGNLPNLLLINGINVGEVTQHLMISLLFPLLTDIDYASILLEENKPNSVYIQSDIFTLEQAFLSIADELIACSFFEPKLYRHIKKVIADTINYNIFKRNILENPYLYLIENDDKEKKFNVFFDVPYNNDVSTVIPVIRELINRRSYRCYIYTDRSFIANKLSNENIKVVKKDIKMNQKRKQKEIRNYFRRVLLKDNDFKAIFTYKGINFWDFIKTDIQLLFDKEFDLIINDIYRFDEILRLVNPDILVVGDDRATRVRGHVILAKKNGIPILDVQHGAYPAEKPMDVPLANKLAAGGNYYKQVYEKFGALEEQIVVTGWPKFDIYNNLDDKLESNLLDDEIKYILFATEPTDIKFNLEIIRHIDSFLDMYPNLRLIVKPHPIENVKIYIQLSKTNRRIIVQDSKENIAKLLKNADILLVTLASTVALEAAILDKPIIYINEIVDPILESTKIAIIIKTLDELLPAIQNALYKEEWKAKLLDARKKFVYEHAYIQDGNASLRVGNLISQMILDTKGEFV